MLAFPQLSTGAAALYPVTRQAVTRSVVNVLGDGRTDVLADPDAAYTAWDLRARGLTLAEWNAIEALFQQTAGRWGNFTLLDPTGNLLARSENLADAVWTNGPLLQLTGGITDPLGTARATRVVNTGGAEAAVAQTLGVPGDFQYCLSVWARSPSGSGVTLAMGGVRKDFALSAQWRRIFLSSNPEQAGGVTVVFAAQVDAGASVELFGMQAEGQLGFSDYKPTGARGGVYSGARFDMDQLKVTAQGTDVFDAVIRIVNTES